MCIESAGLNIITNAVSNISRLYVGSKIIQFSNHAFKTVIQYGGFFFMSPHKNKGIF